MDERVRHSDSLVQGSEGSEVVQCTRPLCKKSEFNFKHWSLLFSMMSTALMILTLIGVAILIPLVMNDGKHQRKTNVTHGTEGTLLNTLPQHQFMPIKALNEIPLEMIERMESLTLQWGATGSGEEVKYYFQIEFAKQDKLAGMTTLGLSFGHKLISSNYQAILYDSNQDVIGTIQFDNQDDLDELEMPNTQRVIEEYTQVLNEETGNPKMRQLGKNPTYGKYPNTDLGYADSFFDAYCRYGCGGMAVTFPYYYRPFFGYGFPLVGTEAMFPQGYGGYPAAELLASQAGSVPLQAVSSPRTGGPGNGAATAPNGAMGASISAGTGNMQSPIM